MRELEMHKMYMDIALRISEMSYDHRSKVGGLLVKDHNIISFGWNGTPSGFDNTCQDEHGVTKPEVIHAEQNILAKASRGTQSTIGSTLYVTLSPCWYCAGLIIQSGINEVVYYEKYRKSDAIDFLRKSGVIVTNFKKL